MESFVGIDDGVISYSHIIYFDVVGDAFGNI